MSEPLVAVFVVMNDDLKQAKRSLLSLVDQTYSNVEIAVVFAGKKNKFLSELRRLADTYFPQSPFVKADEFGGVPKTLNALISKTSATYIGILSAGDIYRPERLKICAEAAQERDSSIMITYAEPLDYDGQVIPSDHAFFKFYTQGLLTNIAAHPCLSFVVLWYDLILSPGNLFFGAKLFREIGGFRDFETLYAYDFFLRSSHLEEPAVLAVKTISCRPIYTDRHLNDTRAISDERAEIIRDHLLDLLAKPPKNPMSDVFAAHPFMFAGAPWSPPLADAVDSMVEKRLPENKEKAIVEGRPLDPADKKKTVTLLTHELSLTGAPVIILEMASLLRRLGYSVNVISPSDGPLRDDFERRGISIVVLPGLHPRLQSLAHLVSKPESRRELVGLLKWIAREVLGVLKNILLFRAKNKLSQAIEGSFLINSVAAWEWVYVCLKASDAKVIWYVHETFDPKWMAHRSADKLFRRRIAEGALSMLYGSEATRKLWASEGYPGTVKYWSGISSDAYPGHQLRSLKKDRDRRVILNVGSFGSRKGTRVLLEAFALGRRQGIIPSDVELCIVGCPRPSGNQEARDILFRANKPDLQGFVRIVGQLCPDAIDSYYDEADVYIHASFFDCMPIALLTAMARGLPIAATNVDGCGEAIVDEVSGLLVPPRCPQLLANAMVRLLNDKELSERLSKGARDRFVKVFSVEATFEPVKNILDRQIADTASQRKP